MGWGTGVGIGVGFEVEEWLIGVGVVGVWKGVVVVGVKKEVVVVGVEEKLVVVLDVVEVIEENNGEQRAMPLIS